MGIRAWLFVVTAGNVLVCGAISDGTACDEVGAAESASQRSTSSIASSAALNRLAFGYSSSCPSILRPMGDSPASLHGIGRPTSPIARSRVQPRLADSPSSSAKPIPTASSDGNASYSSYSIGLDEYGGVLEAPSPRGGTGYFHLEKTAGGRWLLVSPQGHYMWMLSVSGLDPHDGGPNYAHRIAAKYGSAAVWARQALLRITSWGFNIVGEYYAVGGYNVLPVTTYHMPPNPIRMPFVRLIRPSRWCTDSNYQVKNLFHGTNPAIFSVERSFPDVFDPNWTTCANYVGANGGGEFQPPLSPTISWMLGTAVDEGDDIFGFTRATHPHLGWIVAISSPIQTSGNGIPYTKQSVYAKLQWQKYLQAKYHTIVFLNKAWGSTYTSFGSAGGWPKSTTRGSGLMDEDGSSPWIGKGSSGLSGANPKTKADLDDFLGQIADQYFKTLRQACKSAFPNHLVLGPGSLHAATYPQVLQKAGQYLDLPEVWVEPISVNDLAHAYTVSGRPMYAFTTVTSQEDTEANGGAPWGGACTGNYDFCTQSERGTGYQNLVKNYWNTKASDGSYPIVGFSWWEWADKVVGGESMNFGLVSQYDNSYDGREDQIAEETDPWGYKAGAEPARHGDFLTAVREANLSILRNIAKQRN